MSESLRVVCGYCHTTNRVPESRVREQPKCGHCKKNIFTGRPLDVDQKGLTKMISGNDIPVVVDFWAPWCGPCKSFTPTYQQAASTLEPNYRFVKLNTETHPQAGAAFGIRSIPTLAVFKGGKEVGRQSGALPLPAFQQWLKQI